MNNIPCLISRTGVSLLFCLMMIFGGFQETGSSATYDFSNLLTNSSFEVGLYGWEVRSGTVNVLKLSDVPHGSYVLQITNGGSLSADWKHVNPKNEPLEFSVYARCSKPGAVLSLNLFNALNREQQEKYKLKAWNASKEFTLTDTWQRYTWTIVGLALSWKDAYRPVIAVSNGEVFIDAVSFQPKGENYKYKPGEAISISAATQDDYNIISEGDAPLITIRSFSEDAGIRPSALDLRIIDINSNTVYSNKYELVWQPTGHVNIEATIPALAIGYYSAEISSVSPSAQQTKFQMNFAVVKDLSSIPRDRFNRFGTQDLTKRDITYALRVGFSFVRRVNFPNWDKTENQRDEYHWDDSGNISEIVNELNNNGLKIIANPGLTPDWARSTKIRLSSIRPEATPPEDPEQFAKFCGHAVDVYGDRIKIWEIWNEPNTKSFWNGSIEEYVEILRHAAKAIKAKDPKAEVWAGSTWDMDFAWIRSAVDFGLLKYADSISPHGYRNKLPETWETDLLNLRRILKENNRENYPVNISEFGYQGVNESDLNRPYLTELRKIEGTILDERQQAAFLVRSFIVAFANDVKSLTWYKWSERRDNNIGPDPYGLVKVWPMYQPKPGLVAFNIMVSQLSNYDTIERLDVGDPNSYVYRFDLAKRSVWVCWGIKGARWRSVSVPAKTAERAIDLFGKGISIKNSGSTLDVPISEEPVFIVVEQNNPAKHEHSAEHG